MRNTSICFFLFEETSCFNAVFGFAKQLQNRGANVTVVVKKGTKLPDYYRSQGFQEAELDFDACRPTDHKINKRSVLGFSRIFSHGPNFLSRAQVISRFIEEKAVDLCFLDNIRPDVNMVSAVLIGKRVPVILLSVNFASNLTSDYPPAFSSFAPNEENISNLLWRSFYTALWIWACCTEGHTAAYSPKQYLERSVSKILNPIKDMRYERELRQLSIHSTWGEWKRHPILPTIVFGHRKLDWNTAASDSLRCYFGSTDIYRESLSFDWSNIDDEKRIVYCSISTLADLKIISKEESLEDKKIPYGARKGYSLTLRYLDAAIDAFSLRDDWQLILACGPFYETIKRRTLPKNIHLFDRVPQLAVLNRADVVICWGGAGTVRESVNLKVPMLIFPFWTDQYGNAARVVSRNVGLCGDIRKITAEKVVSMIEKALGDCSIRASLEEVAFNRDSKQELEEVLDFVSLHSALSL